MGEDHTSLGPPDYVVEGSFLHALRIVDALTTHGNIDWSTIRHVTIGTSGQHWPSVLAKWFKRNTFELQSSAASEIITTLERVKLSLNCPLLFTSLPSDFLQIMRASDQSPSGTILETAKRLYMHIIPQALRRWGDSISSLPWTKKEVKAHLKRRYNEDESKLISILAREGSVACHNYTQLDLNRS